ncbi:uncharacterized protein LOC112576952 [Pomacea canaliculata]|uniref:uncharacterized protein LOC112576952 n=1 Tax=Pomacea canaliculata TaxID=400727 RepID=UPI000D73CED5|nr:uncharacterized protein LOC112576952 [Pomacea canaliculata]
MKPFEEHPIIILSCVVHWSALCFLFPNSRPLSVLLSDLPSLLLDTDRFLTDGTLLFAPGSARKSFVLGATVFAQLLHRNWRTSHPVDKLLQVLMEKDCKALSVLNELVLLFLSDPHMIHGLSAEHEEFGPKQWLGEMWQKNLWLFKEAMSSQKQTSQCSRLARFGRESLRNLVIFRCMRQMTLHKISMDADVVALVVHLCFSLCQVFEEASSFSQHMIQTSDVHEIANTVRQLVTTAPLHILQNLDVNELKTCGLDIFYLQQQRLKTGL